MTFSGILMRHDICHDVQTLCQRVGHGQRLVLICVDWNCRQTRCYSRLFGGFLFRLLCNPASLEMLKVHLGRFRPLEWRLPPGQGAFNPSAPRSMPTASHATRLSAPRFLACAARPTADLDHLRVVCSVRWALKTGRRGHVATDRGDAEAKAQVEFGASASRPWRPGQVGAYQTGMQIRRIDLGENAAIKSAKHFCL